MVGITLTPNMILSLFENEVIDKHSIFQIAGSHHYTLLTSERDHL
ncbi:MULTISPECIES: hypothetical protein [Enterococcus]|jgi:hypothetical protein